MSHAPHVDLDHLTLSRGRHDEYEGLVCVVEAANVIAPRLGFAPAPFADDHPSISRVIRAFVIHWNDDLPDDATRTRLLGPYVTRILGTATTAEDEAIRAWLAVDWLARTCAPTWLRRAGLTDHARAVEGTARIVDAATAGRALPTITAARAAAWDAARDAAVAAAWAAARDAALAAAGDAALAAAVDAARDAAGDAAVAAAWAAAVDAAGDAAWGAARDALAPAVERLQRSALALLDAMIEVGRHNEEDAA